ncbi:MAG: hypothetical protein ACOYBY_14440 [Dermatophilaceae bacterium]
MDAVFQLLWVACGLATLVAAVLAARSRAARYVGRVAVALLFLVGGALLHVVNLATGIDYAGFADPAHFAWVTDAWRSVVAPNQALFIGLLVVFEAAMGVLVISGGRRTQVGYVGVIAFYLALWLFGWIETVWCLLMLVPMWLLLRAERQATSAPTIPGAPLPEASPPRVSA